MNIGINLISSNIGMGFEWIMIFLVSVGGIIFYAKNASIGMMCHLLGYALLFAWFFLAGLMYVVPLILMCIVLVLLAFQLYFSSKQIGAAYI